MTKTPLSLRYPNLFKLYNKVWWIPAARERIRYIKSLASNRPYFGPIHQMCQNKNVRHKIMQQLVKLECPLLKDRALKILEIGSWGGASAITWAGAIRKFNYGNGFVICIDPWASYINLQKNILRKYRRMERALRSGKIFNLFLHNIRVSGQSDIVFPFKVSSNEALPLFDKGMFNIVYVDGSHSYQQVLNDLKDSSSLVAEGGILCGDDLELQIFEVDIENAKRNNDVDSITDPRTGNDFHPGVTTAVGEFFQGEVSAWEGFWAMRKQGNCWKKVVWEELDSRNLQVPEHLCL